MRGVRRLRLTDYDYSSNGFYFVTICTDHRKPYLVGSNRELVRHLIEQMPSKVDGVRVGLLQIMPSHIHLILILEDCRVTLGEIVRRLKAAATRQAGFKLWQPNYYEHVIRNENALARIREYIQNNPAVEMLQSEWFHEP